MQNPTMVKYLFLRNVYMCRPMMMMFNRTPHLELWARNLHYTGNLGHAISKKIHYYRRMTKYVWNQRCSFHYDYRI
jgi:hypothetical protein